MNIHSGIHAPSTVTLSEVFDTPRISGPMDDREIARRARIRAHMVKEDPFVVDLPGEDIPF